MCVSMRLNFTVSVTSPALLSPNIIAPATWPDIITHAARSAKWT